MNTRIFRYRLGRLCAFIIGLVFFLAGAFKLLDPVGAGLVVEEYYHFLGMNFLLPTAKTVAVILALVEALLGAALIAGVWRKPVAIATTLMIVLFTVLTLFLAIFNPSMDCGCFGEVIHLSNLQTFIKNLILLALAAIAFIPFKDFGEPRKRKYVSFAIAAVSVIAFTAYSLSAIPLVDYTSFVPGSELYTPDGEDGGEAGYVSTFIYEKNGQEGAFSLDKLPDSTWTYVRTETIKVNGPSIPDESPILAFSDSTGTYRDELALDGNVLAISVHDPSNMKGDGWTKISETVSGASKAGFTPLLLVRGSKSTLENLPAIVPEVLEGILPFSYYSDRKTLLAMNRSNGGATWFNEGQLIRKYHFNNLPGEEEMLAMTGAEPTEVMLRTSTKGKLRFQGFLLYTLAILLLI